MKSFVLFLMLVTVFSLQQVVSQTIDISYREGGSENVKFKNSTATGQR